MRVFSMPPPRLLHPSCTCCDQAADVLLMDNGPPHRRRMFERLPGSDLAW